MVTYPSDWLAKRVDNFAEISRGASPRPIESYLTNSPDGVNWIKIGDASTGSSYITKTAERITKAGADKSVRVDASDLVLSNSMSFGRPYLLNIDGCIHDGWLHLYNFQQCADAKFLVYLLASPPITDQYKAFAAGSGVQNLNKDVVSGVIAHLPSLAEQRTIAEVLSGFDEHLANLDELITKKKAIRDGAVEELVTGRTRIADYRAPWVTRSARELLSDVITGGTPSTTIAEYWDGGIPWLSSTEIHQRTVSRPTRYISEEGLANSSAQIAPAGSVLIALAGQGKTRGTSAYLTRDMALNQSLAGLVADETELYRGYLLYAVTRRYEELRGLSSGDGGRGGLNKTLLWDLRFTLPSSLEEQCAIAEVLSGMDEEIRLLAEERAKVERLKLGAMDDLLTGRVRLPLKEEAA